MSSRSRRSRLIGRVRGQQTSCYTKQHPLLPYQGGSVWLAAASPGVGMCWTRNERGHISRCSNTPELGIKIRLDLCETMDRKVGGCRRDTLVVLRRVVTRSCLYHKGCSPETLRCREPLSTFCTVHGCCLTSCSLQCRVILLLMS